VPLVVNRDELAKRLTNEQTREIVKLAQAGISIAQIAKKLGIKKTTVYYHAQNHCRKMTKLDINLLTEFEKGYIVGFFLGDGSFNFGRKARRYIVRFYLDAERDRDISTYLRDVFQKGRKRVSIFVREANIILRASSKELVDFIRKYVEYKRNLDNQLEKELKSRELPEEFQFGVLSGIIDSDGHVHEHLGTEIKTVSELMQKRILDILKNLRIQATLKVRDATENSFSKRPRYVIYISSAEMRAKQEEINSVKVRRYG